MTPEQIIGILITALTSIFVGTITFAIAKSAENKKLEVYKKDSEKRLTTYQKMESDTNAKLTEMLQRLTEEVGGIKIGMARLSMKVESYDLIWKKFGEHDEKFSTYGARISVTEAYIDATKNSGH